MKSSDQLMIVGYVVIAPHMSSLVAGLFSVVAFIAAVALREFGK